MMLFILRQLAPRLHRAISDALEPALRDGHITASEAEELAVKAWRAAEDRAGRDLLTLRIQGVDVLDERSEELLARLLARTIHAAADR